MWQLVDIAYVIPAAVFIGYGVGKFLETKYEGDYFVNSVLIAAALGLLLTIMKIKRFVDESNKKLSHKTPSDQEALAPKENKS